MWHSSLDQDYYTARRAELLAENVRMERVWRETGRMRFDPATAGGGAEPRPEGADAGLFVSSAPSGRGSVTARKIRHSPLA
jgi:hypothetical protein